MRKFEVILPDNSGIFTESKSLLAAKQYATRIAKHFFTTDPLGMLYLFDRTRDELYCKRGKNGTWMRDYDEHPVNTWQCSKPEAAQ